MQLEEGSAVPLVQGLLTRFSGPSLGCLAPYHRDPTDVISWPVASPVVSPLKAGVCVVSWTHLSPGVFCAEGVRTEQPRCMPPSPPFSVFGGLA